MYLSLQDILKQYGFPVSTNVSSLIELPGKNILK